MHIYSIHGFTVLGALIFEGRLYERQPFYSIGALRNVMVREEWHVAFKEMSEIAALQDQLHGDLSFSFYIYI